MPAERLRRQLADLTFPLDARARTEVRRCVDEYVDLLKTQDAPPERVLIELKRVAEEAGVRSRALRAAESRGSRSDLMMDMVAWSIERYYRAEKRDS
jgi:hypothetical protein